MSTEEVLARRQRLLTGERTSPGIAHEAYWFTRHEAAYAWAVDRFGPVARACDAGSGEGYGTACLRAIADVACGVELDPLELLRWVAANFDPMNALCERAGLSERAIYDRSKAVFEYFGFPYDAPPPG